MSEFNGVYRVEPCACCKRLSSGRIESEGAYLCKSCKDSKFTTPEPTFTLAQVKEIIEGIAVRVEAIPLELINEYTDSRGEDGTPLLLGLAAKIVRETTI